MCVCVCVCVVVVVVVVGGLVTVWANGRAEQPRL